MIHYLIAGQGEQMNELQKTIDQLNLNRNVHLLGYKTNIADLYQASDICVFPSIREGLGLAGIEGMASGLPLIVSDNRGTRDFAYGDGSLVCRFDDIEGFANAILELKDDPARCRKMGYYNKQKSRNFDISVTEYEMEEIYNAISL